MESAPHFLQLRFTSCCETSHAIPLLYHYMTASHAVLKCKPYVDLVNNIERDYCTLQQIQCFVCFHLKLRPETVRLLRSPWCLKKSDPENPEPWQAKQSQHFEGCPQQTLLSCYNILHVIILTKGSTLFALGSVLSGFTVEPNTILPETWNK